MSEDPGSAARSSTAPERPRGIRTGSAWLLAIPFLVFARPTPELLGVGAVLVALGLALRGWAAGAIRKDEALATGGPYAYVRHPLYVGSFLVGIGLAVSGGHWVWVALVVVFFLVIYRRTVVEEGERLSRLFGARYDAYVERVPALVPRLTPYRPGVEADPPTAPLGFAWTRYLRNREWEALLGAAAALALLAAKLRWIG